MKRHFVFVTLLLFSPLGLVHLNAEEIESSCGLTMVLPIDAPPSVVAEYKRQLEEKCKQLQDKSNHDETAPGPSIPDMDVPLSESETE